MLILTRKRGESIYIGGRIKVTVVELKGTQVRIGIEAPQEERVYREEIYLQILEENKQAAEAAGAIDSLSDAWKKKGTDDSKQETEGGVSTPNIFTQAPLRSLTKASVKGQDIPVFKKRKKEREGDE